MRLLLKRFGFKLQVDYDVEVVSDHAKKRVVYRCSAPGKLFIVIVSAEPHEKGARVVVEAQYSGDYERFSRPLLNEFVEAVAGKLRSLVAEARETRLTVTTSPLSDPSLMARAIVSGKMLVRERVDLADEEAVSGLLKKLSEMSRGRTLLVRLTSTRTEDCIRVFLRNGEIVDAMIESGARREQGISVVEKLLDLLRGEWNMLVIELPS